MFYFGIDYTLDINMPARVASPGLGPSKRRKANGSHSHFAASHPEGVLPSGNAFFSTSSIRASSLGRLAALPDSLLLSIISLLSSIEWAHLQSVSHACRAFALYESHWKEEVIRQTGGQLRRWHGSWRKTYVGHIYPTYNPSSTSDRIGGRLIRAKDLFSDTLFLPMKLATTPLDAYIPSSFVSKRHARSLERLFSSKVTSQHLMKDYIAKGVPCLIVEDESRDTLPRWDLGDLTGMYSRRRIRAEATKWSMEEYARYARCCQDAECKDGWVPDESPFYLFDPTLAKQMQKEGQFVVPPLLREKDSQDAGSMRQDWDLFSLLQESRPDNAWIIAGPSRSGSGWHVDPNSTSAYNTVLSGRKLWLLLPPTVTPPGIFISDDHSSVTAPLSIVEWLTNFWDDAIRQHGHRGDNTLVVDVCEAGETIFVPSRWHHLVINLEESVAFTQNFCSPAELPYVLDMFKNRPEQISGFRTKKEGSSGDESDQELDELPEDGIREKRALYDSFVARLRRFSPDVLEAGLRAMEGLERKKREQDEATEATLNSIARIRRDAMPGTSSLWNSLTSSKETATDQSGNTGFSFDLGDEEEEAVD